MNLKTRILGVVGAAALSLAVVSPAFAQTATTTVNAGTLTLTNSGAITFPAVTYSSTATPLTQQTYTLHIDDDRGTEAGWDVVLQQSTGFQFEAIDGTVTPTFLAVSAATVAADTDNPGQAIHATGGPRAGTAGTLSATAKMAVEAAAGFGTGHYSAAVPMDLTIPAKTKVGSYTSTVTATIDATGPSV